MLKILRIFFKKSSLLITLFLIASIFLTLNLLSKSQDIRKKAAQVKESEVPLSIRSSKPEYIENEILVKFRNNVAVNFKDIEKQADLTAQTNLPSSLKELNLRNPIKQIEKVFPQSSLNTQNIDLQDSLARIYRVTFVNKADIEKIIPEMIINPEVEYVEPNFSFKAQVQPNDPFYQDSYPDANGFRDPKYNPAFDYQWNLKKIKAPEVWDITTGSDSVIVAVVDTGLDYTHLEMGGCTSIQVNNNSCGFVAPGYDFYNKDNDPLDDNGHGTFVSGLIAAETNNNLGIASINWQLKLLPIKVLNKFGSGSNLTVSQGIKYAADNNANIINLSLGNGVAFQPMPRVLNEAITYADSLGVVIVAASGNNADNVYKGYWPAADSRVISVGATNHLDQITSYSNYGKVEVVAPGSDIVSLRADKTDLYLNSPGYTTGANIIAENYYHANGTSFAAPHVSGLAALILAKNPALEKNPTLIKNIISNGADDLLPLGFDDQSGYGRINLNRSATMMNVTPLPQAQITYPVDDLLINPVNGIPIMGVASGLNFEYFEINYYPLGKPENKQLIVKSSQALLKPDILANWHQRIENGEYVLELKVIYDGGKSKSNQINIRVDNDLKAGWPVDLGSSVFESPTVADLNNDGKQEILVITQDLQFLIYNSDGTLFAPWPKNIKGWSVGIPAIGNFDNDSDLEIAIPDPSGINQLLVYNYDGTRVPGQWIVPTGSINSGITAADLDSDGKDEPMIVIRNPHGLMVWDDNGEPFPGNWPYLSEEECYPSSGYYYGYPAVFDKEIVLQDQSCLTVLKANGDRVFSQKLEIYSDSSFRSPALGDINNDGLVEIVIIDGKDNLAKLKVFDSQGNLKNGFPQTLSSFPFNHGWYSPSLVDIDRDRFLEIIAGYSIYKHTGTLLKNLTGSVNDVWSTNIISGDIDNDGKLEYFSQNIYQSDSAIRLYGWKDSGTSFTNFPKLLTKPPPGAVIGGSFNVNSPLITDLDKDGVIDLIVTNKSFLYVFELKPKVYNLRELIFDWPMHYQNFAHTSFYTPLPSSPKKTCYKTCAENSDCELGQVCGTIKPCDQDGTCRSSNFCHNPLCPPDKTCLCRTPFPTRTID